MFFYALSSPHFQLPVISCHFCTPPTELMGKELNALMMAMFAHLEQHEHMHHADNAAIQAKVKDT